MEGESEGVREGEKRDGVTRARLLEVCDLICCHASLVQQMCHLKADILGTRVTKRNFHKSWTLISYYSSPLYAYYTKKHVCMLDRHLL